MQQQCTNSRSGRRRNTGKPTSGQAFARIEDAAFLLRQGQHPEAVSLRIGLTADSLLKSFCTWGCHGLNRPQPADALHAVETVAATLAQGGNAADAADALDTTPVALRADLETWSCGGLWLALADRTVPEDVDALPVSAAA
jgi:hypothetical protein